MACLNFAGVNSDLACLNEGAKWSTRCVKEGSIDVDREHFKEFGSVILIETLVALVQSRLRFSMFGRANSSTPFVLSWNFNTVHFFHVRKYNKEDGFAIQQKNCWNLSITRYDNSYNSSTYQLTPYCTLLWLALNIFFHCPFSILNFVDMIELTRSQFK